MSDDDDEDEEPAKRCPPPLPGWIMTFADLMSLLLCFFVLLLSFATMDASKFKSMAGSMSKSFGVQQEKRVFELPKGTSAVALEFSLGKAQPTPIDAVQQITVDLREEAVRPRSSKDQETDGYEKGMAPQSNPDQTLGGVADNEIIEKSEALEQLLKEALQSEIKLKMISIENDNGRVIIRIKENGSFTSGSADIKKGFLPVLKRIAKHILRVEGQIIVAGHTDNRSIKTEQFRSNWELASARAVSVLHSLKKIATIKESQYTIEGYADNNPVDSNKTREGRANNRRVELIIIQGKDTVQQNLSISEDQKKTKDDKAKIEPKDQKITNGKSK